MPSVNDALPTLGVSVSSYRLYYKTQPRCSSGASSSAIATTNEIWQALATQSPTPDGGGGGGPPLSA